MMKKGQILLGGILLFLILMLPSKVLALNEVNIYFFHSDSCSICEQEKAYLEALKKRYFNIRIYEYEISTDTNYDLMTKAKKLYNVEESGVPFTVIGDSAFLGFSQSKKCNMEKKIYEYSYHAYENQFGTKILTIGYRNDLEGDVQEHYDESDYVIEENGTTNQTEQKTESKTTFWEDPKYKTSIILISAGVGLGILVLILELLERKRRI